MRITGRTVIAGLALAGVLATTALPADEARAKGDGTTPIVIFGAVLTNIGYLPAKLVYAGLGGITGTLAYLVTGGDTDTATTIWDASCRGTYIVTPEMLEGKRPIHFSGP